LSNAKNKLALAKKIIVLVKIKLLTQKFLPTKNFGKSQYDTPRNFPELT
jgi:hypothetical protein